MAAGFIKEEALQILELCAELNGYGVQDAELPDTSGWEALPGGMDPDNTGKAAHGFGPFDSRWKLWRRTGSNDYAVVIRGTVSDAVSIDEDLMANTLPAEKIIIPAGKDKSISFRLASTSYRNVDESKDWPVPEVHAGFAYGLAVILFDRQFGLIKALQDLPEGSRLYVTGHSQGAGIATLLHSFLHYACAGDRAAITEEDEINYRDCNRFGLEKKNFSIKSYVFAQPKPGNWRYAMDFAQSIGNGGLSYTIDNYDDPVAQTPLAFQLLSDSLTEQEVDALVSKHHRFLNFLMALAGAFRRAVSRGIDKKILDDTFLEDKGKGPYAERIDARFSNGHAKTIAEGGASLNYVPVGNIISVRARREDNLKKYEETRSHDFLWEHHLWRYKQLAKYWP